MAKRRRRTGLARLKRALRAFEHVRAGRSLEHAAWRLRVDRATVYRDLGWLAGEYPIVRETIGDRIGSRTKKHETVVS